MLWPLVPSHFPQSMLNKDILSEFLLTKLKNNHERTLYVPNIKCWIVVSLVITTLYLGELDQKYILFKVQ